ncbi:aldo/keto reductase, partial [mine drainage metagenome]
EYYKRYENDRTRKILDQVEKISAETGKTMAQVALNWVMSNPAVTAPIIGARSVEQLSDNLGATGWHLEKRQIEAINEVSNLEVTYPYDRRSEEQQRSGRELS